MLLFNRALNEMNRVRKRIADIKKEIRGLPNGRIECYTRNDGGYRWKYVKNGKRTEIKKADRELAERLAYKRSLRNELNQLECEYTALDVFTKIMKNTLKYRGDYGDNSNELITTKGRTKKVRVRDLVRPDMTIRKNEEVDRLAQAYLDRKYPDVAGWASADYEQRPDDDNAHKVRAKSGRWHESKDEVLIDNLLMEHGLKVRYEPLLELDNDRLYPDFCILNPKTGEEVYWEHFGMLDRPDYQTRTLWKLKRYVRNGYYPGVNFIATFMGGNHRLDSQYVESIIEYFFE